MEREKFLVATKITYHIYSLIKDVLDWNKDQKWMREVQQEDYLQELKAQEWMEEELWKIYLQEKQEEEEKLKKYMNDITYDDFKEWHEKGEL